MTLGQSSSHPRLSLLTRAFLANAAVLAVAFVLFLVSPVTVSYPIRSAEVLVLTIGLVALLLVNVVLVRRALSPLKELAEQMQGIDLRNPEGRLVGGTESRELAAFTSAFNAMLDRLKEERRAGARAALTAQERERLRIARALHDEAGQTLTAVALEVERVAEDAPSEERRLRLMALVDQLHSTLDEIRRITRELRPEALDDLGLINALIALTSRVARQSGIPVERQLSGDLPPLSSELELVIYRVAQEALTNVLRHAKASRCVVSLRSDDGMIELSVRDDGRGMPDRLVGETTGLAGMRERALLTRGTLVVKSPPAGGTVVTLSAPVAASDPTSSSTPAEAR